MNITEARIRNFLTIGEAKLHLDNRGLVLIQGENHDDPSAKSNGAGKSSVADAICWALFGRTARGISGDAVINKTAKKGCEVKLKVQVNGDIYYISRGRKSTRLKNRLFVESIGEDGAPIDLTGGTDKITQETLERLIGCNYDVFSTAVYAGQESMPDLPSMTDKQLKELIEEAAGIKRLQRAHDIAKAKLRDAEIALTKADANVEASKAQLTYLDNMMKAEEHHSKAFEKSRQERANHLESAIRAEFASVKHDSAIITDETMAAKRAEIERLQKILNAVYAEHVELRTLTSELADLQASATYEESTLKTLSRRADSARQELDRVGDRVGKPCGECGKLYVEADIEDARVFASNALNNVLSEQAQQQEQLNTARAALESHSKRVSEFRDNMTDVSEVSRALSVLRSEEGDLKAFAAAINERKKRLRQDAARLKEIKKEKNPHIDAYKGYEAKLDDAAKTYDESISGKKLCESTASLYKEAVDIYGPSGVRAHILDTVTPFLNDRTGHYLGTLSDGNISAEWSTIGLTAKGEAREKFNIEVTNRTGAASFGGLSGGEKRKVRLATAMALQDLVASRATQPISLFMADEIDDALDDVGLERLMGILDEKAKQRGTVLVISHNELSDWIRDTATVVKRGGYATVEGVLT